MQTIDLANHHEIRSGITPTQHGLRQLRITATTEPIGPCPNQGEPEDSYPAVPARPCRTAGNWSSAIRSRELVVTSEEIFELKIPLPNERNDSMHRGDYVIYVWSPGHQPTADGSDGSQGTCGSAASAGRWLIAIMFGTWSAPAACATGPLAWCWNW
jgi:hypothetical protein